MLFNSWKQGERKKLHQIGMLSKMRSNKSNGNLLVLFTVSIDLGYLCVWMFSNFWGSQKQSKFSFVFSMRLYCCCYLFYYCGHLCVCALAHVIMRANTRVCYEVLRFVSEFAIWCGFFFASISNFALLLFCVSFTFVCLCFYRFLLTFIGVCGIGYVLD